VRSSQRNPENVTKNDSVVPWSQNTYAVGHADCVNVKLNIRVTGLHVNVGVILEQSHSNIVNKVQSYTSLVIKTGKTPTPICKTVTRG